MRKILILSLFIGCTPLYAQWNTFPNELPSPITGDRSNVIVEDGYIRLQAPTSTTESYLSFPTAERTACKYSFTVGYDIEPSTSNYMALIIKDSIRSDVYWSIQVGGTSGSNDKILVWWHTPQQKTLLWQSVSGIGSVFPIEVNLEVLTQNHESFQLSYHAGTTKGSGEWNVPEVLLPNSIDWKVWYTSTRTTKYRLLSIDSEKVFAIHSTFIQPDYSRASWTFNTTIIGYKTDRCPLFSSAHWYLQDSTLHIIFASPLPVGSYTLDSIEITSASGISNWFSLQLVRPITIFEGMIRITEVMSDPLPSFSSIQTEYIELSSFSLDTITTANWSLQDNSGLTPLPFCTLYPGTVIIVVPEGACPMFPGKTCVEWYSFPSLNNDADYLTLYYRERCIDSVSYHIIPGDYRSEGGYAFHRNRIPSVCRQDPTIEYTSTASDPGIHSTHFFTPPVLTVTFKDSTTIIVETTEASHVTSAEGTVESLTTYTHWFTPHTVPSAGFVYPFNIQLQSTCRSYELDTIVQIIFPKKARRGDLYISEVLADALPYQYEYIEIVNTTNQYLLLQDMQIQLKSVQSLKQMHIPTGILPPLSYVAGTADTNSIRMLYAERSGYLQEWTNWESIDDEACSIVLKTGSQVLDSIYYTTSLHSVFQSETEGWGIEKVIVEAPLFYTDNWTTAPQHGSPGLFNSFSVETTLTNTAYCSPCHLHIGSSSASLIGIHLPKTVAGSRASISIYTLEGQFLHQLVSNVPHEPHRIYQWDGSGLESILPWADWYVAQVLLWDATGDKKTYHVLISAASF
ncbi:MAG: lamin tail domain-containing protein [Cytophagaceae bacterium]|jgi:hypothetical protein|nr:lamin tail domain-containing protein [Cytophagaceae bacterium]